jgi:uncharacterized membrane protein YfcA
MNPLAAATTLLVGLLLGSMGSGGSIVMLPILVYLAGVPPKTAVPMSMLIVGSTSLAAAALHARKGNFHLKGALLLGTTGMLGAFCGSLGTHFVSSTVLMLCFAALLLSVGTVMLRRGARNRQVLVCRPARCLSAGFGVGILTGFLGVGGGFLIVPALIFFAGLDAAMAVGTSLGVITLNSAAGLLGQLRFVSVDWSATAGYVLLALAGMAAGLQLRRFLPEKILPAAFGTLVILTGLIIAVLNLKAL